MTALLVILTGASRGLGQAMAAQYLADGAFVLGLSRRQSAELRRRGAGGLEQWPVDLADPLPVAERLAAWLADFERRAARRAAGARARDPQRRAAQRAGQRRRRRPGRPRAQPAHRARGAGRADRGLPARDGALAASDRRVLFVSSGLGRRAMAGSAAYCAQKAGLDHFARALALEEAARPHGARVAVGRAGHHRHRHAEAAARRRSAALRGAGAPSPASTRSGALDSPAAAAAKVIALLERADYGANPVTDVRELISAAQADTVTGTRSASAHISS